MGNIGGVAVAISLGGPGAAFWLFIAGLLSMSTKLVECTLGVKYRRYNADGSVSGGPMFYMEACFRERGWPGIGKGFGCGFSCFATFLAAAASVHFVLPRGKIISEAVGHFGDQVSTGRGNKDEVGFSR